MVVGRRFTRKKENTWHIIQDYKVIHLQEKTLKTVFHCSFFVCLSPRHTTDQMTRLTHLNISFTSPTSPKPKDNHFRMIYEREKRQMSPHKNMEQEICFFFFYCFGRKKCLKLIILMIRIGLKKFVQEEIYPCNYETCFCAICKIYIKRATEWMCCTCSCAEVIRGVSARQRGQENHLDRSQWRESASP